MGLRAKCALLAWKKNVASVNVGQGKGCPRLEEGEEPSGRLDLAFRRADGRAYVVGEASGGSDPTGGGHSEQVSAYWTPDGSVAALVRQSTDNVLRGGTLTTQSTLEPVIVRFEPVRVSVLAVDVSGSTEKLIALLRQRGGLFVTSGKAQSPRTETVVYAAKGYEAQAAELAKFVPGARVEALTWQADADVLVALAK